DKYYGFTYERSLIHFYQSLNRFLLSQQKFYEGYKKGEKDFPQKELNPSEITRERQAARAELLEWDSYLKDVKNQKLGNSVFKVDLLAKTFGAYVHESFNTVNDDQVALRLYQDAKLFLFRNYNSYRTFNRNFKKFRGDYSKLPKMKKEVVEKKYVNMTEFQKTLKDFLDFKILSLIKKIRPRDYKKQVRLQKPTKKTLEALKKYKNRSNVGIVFQKGFIPKKNPSKQYFGLGAVIDDPNASGAAKAAAAIGSVVLTVYAAQTLGLMPPPRSYNPIGAHMGIRVAEGVARHSAISFELPKMENRPSSKMSYLKISNSKDKKTIRSVEVPVVNPLGDIAAEAIAEDSAARYARIGTRLALKHIAAILASYTTYKAMISSDKPKFIAKNVAVLQYLAAAKGIQMSEKADIRYWSSLPQDLRFVDFYIPEGEYQLNLELKKGKKLLQSIDLGKQKMKKNHQLLNVSSRI
ncbi:MAG: hypothetical protein ACPGJV_03915, partial [Bacteriovoracaceae bacterium]